MPVFILSVIGLIIVVIPTAYLLLLALASIVPPKRTMRESGFHHFAVVIPAHDEENVIEATIKQLHRLNYSPQLYDIHLVADHCSDNTANVARRAGAIAHERNEGPRSGKGAALSWLFQRLFDKVQYDAIIVFDADTQVDPDFLRVMDARLQQGYKVIQGQHIISNPDDGWFPALVWAMFLVDNRFQNLGRSNLHWSAKNMGDAICIHADLIRQIGWGEGLTEDYQLRQRFLLAGFPIVYEPFAIAYGEAPLTWSQARAQRTRWLRGTQDASQQLRGRLWTEGIRRRDPALLEGALQAYLPSYSTVTVLTLAGAFLQLALNGWLVVPYSLPLLAIWVIIAILLFIYPYLGLLLERAPLKAYLALMSGPLFILWRSGLALSARWRGKSVIWIRTAHGGGR
jgi:cellulose synthase/poly-beta-1,6-N-acetylglucosamine synthase-like glycosyltransferase